MRGQRTILPAKRRPKNGAPTTQTSVHLPVPLMDVVRLDASKKGSTISGLLTAIVDEHYHGPRDEAELAETVAAR